MFVASDLMIYANMERVNFWVNFFFAGCLSMEKDSASFNFQKN